MKQIIAYQCSYCSFYRKTKRIVKEHEKKCFYNPQNRVCGSCKHNILTEMEYELLEFGEIVHHITQVRFCTAKEKMLDEVITQKECKLWEPKDES